MTAETAACTNFTCRQANSDNVIIIIIIIYGTDECPRKENGKKVGIMELTKRFWDSMGYSQLSKTSQTLADKYRHLQKTANIPSLLIQAEIQSQTIKAK